MVTCPGRPASHVVHFYLARENILGSPDDMNIADGEYDIDLSVLVGNGAGSGPESASLAVRYGFIPDSMDQSSALHLYQGDQICILEALSTEKLKNIDALPIIFEGVPQKQRPQASASAPNDSYYLSFTPSGDALEADVKVALRKLGSTIRVSKSRNAEKWRTLIREWRSLGPLNNDVIFPVEKSRPEVTKPRVKSAPPAPKVQKAAPKKLSRPAAKRPPAENPPNNDIISVSDFEDLESDGTSEYKNGNNNKQTEGARRTQNIAKMTAKAPAGEKVPNMTVSKSSDQDLDDEWADLEDQLEEVLESDQAQNPEPTSGSDDDSAFEDVIKAEPIIIDVKEEKKAPHQTIKPRSGANKTPMSLRQLHGSTESNDYLSSSEEE